METDVARMAVLVLGAVGAAAALVSGSVLDAVVAISFSEVLLRLQGPPGQS